MGTNNINIAELLKDCPEGTKLYSPICGECEFDGITDLGYISTFYSNGEAGYYDGYGHTTEDIDHSGECLLFPSKKVRDWNCWKVPFMTVQYDTNIGGKYDQDGKRAAIIDFLTKKYQLKSRYVEDYDEGSAGLIYLGRDNKLYYVVHDYYILYDYILSTGTELKLEEEQPKFKVGDVIGSISPMVVVSDYIQGVSDDYQIPLDWANDSKYDYSYASEAQIAKWNEETLHLNHLHYSKSKRKIIHWFLPFDRVVVRNYGENWEVALFSYYDNKGFIIRPDGNRYACQYIAYHKGWHLCLPYNSDTARLIGTTDDYKEE